MRAEDYRDWGARCMLMALEASDPDQKAALLEMAKRWNELADQVEHAQIDDHSPSEQKIRRVVKKAAPRRS